MNKENSLEEEDRHGTKLMPVHYMYFKTGSMSYLDYFFVKRHWHNSCEILHIIKGRYEIELDFVNIILKEGDYCFVNSGELHELKGLEKNTLHEVIIFRPDILDFSYEDELEKNIIGPLINKEISFPKVINHTEEAYVDIAKAYGNITKACRDNDTDWYFETKMNLFKIMQLLYKYNLYQLESYAVNESEKIKIDRYKTIVSYMHEHYMEQVSLNDLQQAAGCNEKYLCYFFKSIAGVSPIQYLIQYRLQEAEYMLKHTTKSVLEISLDCGFDNISYFIRQFKKNYGITPLQYRKSLDN